MQFDSLDFYKEHARRYSQLSHEFAHSVYTDSSHPSLQGDTEKDDTDLLNRVIDLTPGNRGLDAGCGAGARDVYLLHTWGYDVYGVDALEENISLGKELHQLGFAHFKPRRQVNLQVGGTGQPGLSVYQGRRLGFVQSSGIG